MSWSLSAAGANRDEATTALKKAVAENSYTPKDGRIEAAAAAISINMADKPMTFSSSGHLNPDGTGYASVTVNAS